MRKTINGKPYMDPQTMAALLNVTDVYVRKLVADGKLTGVQREHPKNKLWIPEKEALRFIENRTVGMVPVKPPKKQAPEEEEL